MIQKIKGLSRTTYVLIAMVFAVAGLTPVVTYHRASAAPSGGQVQVRSIKLSDSRANQSSVSYDVKFNSATAFTLKGLILDFCDSTSTPIVGDTTCNTTNLGAFTVGASPSITYVSGLTTGYTVTGQNSGRTLRMVKSSGDALTAGQTVNFTITGVHNPNYTGTFYARLITYNSDTGDVLSYAPGTEGNTNAIDYGGFALSTANVITITAKVQETMTFCVSGVAPGPNCGQTGSAVTQPDLLIGHGANTILDSTAVDTAGAFTQLSTNANGGAVIRMRNTATSGGLNSGSNFIPAANSGSSTTPVAFTAGTAAFGVYVASGTGGTGTITADSNYNDGTATHYGMDTTGASGANVLGTYGDAIASATAPVNNVGNALTFAATASNTTPAGLYTANIILIATGTF